MDKLVDYIPQIFDFVKSYNKDCEKKIKKNKRKKIQSSFYSSSIPCNAEFNNSKELSASLSSYKSREGNSFNDCKPNCLKNSSVVPYNIGLPGTSSLPTSFIKSRSNNLCNADSDLTPLISSISTRVIGCLYATIAKLSMEACDNDCLLFFLSSFCINSEFSGLVTN